jgi:hypothetical protein
LLSFLINSSGINRSFNSTCTLDPNFHDRRLLDFRLVHYIGYWSNSCRNIDPRSEAVSFRRNDPSGAENSQSPRKHVDSDSAISLFAIARISARQFHNSERITLAPRISSTVISHVALSTELTK